MCLTGSGPIGDCAAEVLALGCRVYMCDVDRATLDFRRNLRRILNAQQYDAVHCHVGDLSEPALSVAAAAGVPARIAHYHVAGVDPSLSCLRRAVLGFMRYGVLRTATAVVGCSNGVLADKLGSRLARHPKCRVIPNPIDVNELRSLADRAGTRGELGLPELIPVVGHVGRIGPGKNHHGLVRIAERVLTSEACVFVLVGGGRLRPQVEKMVADRGLTQQFRFLGVRSDVPRLLSGMDVLLFPSEWEAFGLAALEAQVCGVPVVAYDVPGLCEAVCPNGSLVPLHDEDAAAAAIVRLIRDESLRREQARQAAAWAELFDVERLVPRFLALYSPGQTVAPPVEG